MDDRARKPEAEATGAPFFDAFDKSIHDDDLTLRKTTRPHRARLVPMVLLGLTLLAGVGLYRFAATQSGPSVRDKKAARPAPPQPVAVATIGTGDIRIVVEALGSVTPIATVTVKSRVAGHLLEVAFTEGQIVKEGDFLAQIDPRPFELARDQQEGQLIHDQGLLDQARANLERYQTLVKQNSIARQQAEDQAFIVKQDEGVVKTDIALIDAQKLNLVYARLTAPVSGRIGLRLVDAGNYVQTTDAGIAVITQLHPISVIFYVPEDDIPKIMSAMRAGRSLAVTAFDRANVVPLAVGKLSTVDNQIDQTTGTVKIRADFDNLDDRLFPNQFVNARLLVETLHDAMTAPLSAIQRGAPGIYAYVVDAENTVSVRPLQLGPTDGAMVAVTSGLSVGDRVVVDGADRLRDGARVAIPADVAAGTLVRHPTAQPADAPEPRRRSKERQKGAQ